MSLIKFLLFDCALIVVGLFAVLIFQREKYKSPLWGWMNSDKNLDQISTNIPSLKDLLELENIAKKEGSGIDFNSLIGLWKFASVWKPGEDLHDSTSSALLRLFSATLELSKDQSKKEYLVFDMTNSIRFGLLSIRFVGSGELKGSQPILPFFFRRIELNLGSSVLINRDLDMPDDKKKPFFALIGIGDNREWLAARGRGGGLALWLKE